MLFCQSAHYKLWYTNFVIIKVASYDCNKKFLHTDVVTVHPEDAKMLVDMDRHMAYAFQFIAYPYYNRNFQWRF